MMESLFTTRNSVVLVPFPFDDFSATKLRPAVCLTNEIGEFDHLVIAFVSSKIPRKLLASDVHVKEGTDAWRFSGLKVDSIIRLHKIVTVPKLLIKRRLGSLNQELSNELVIKLCLLFSCPKM